MGGQSLATTGALVGLVVGGLHYLLALVVMARIASSGLGEDGEAPGAALVARRMRPIKLMLLGVSFLLFPLVGYLAGAMLPTGGVR